MSLGEIARKSFPFSRLGSGGRPRRLFVAAMLLSLSPKTRPLAGRLLVSAGSLFLGALGAGMLVGCYLRLGSWPRPRRWGDIGLFALWVACGLASTTVAVWVLVTALR